MRPGFKRYAAAVKGRIDPDCEGLKMDGKIQTFLLGVIAAVVLFMLWRKEQYNGVGMPTFPDFPTPPTVGPQPSAGCASCGASPSFQSNMAGLVGLDGQISPGTPPLNAVTGGQGATSFYTSDGVTPDVGFTFIPVPRSNVAVGTPVQPGGLQSNVPGSPTTVAAVTPVRATQVVPQWQEQGFVNQYNVTGIPIKTLVQ